MKQQNARRRLLPAAIRKARQAISDAVRSGKIEKPKNCQRCGSHGVLHAHHSNYEKPLKVDWLCPRCHGLTRRKYD